MWRFYEDNGIGNGNDYSTVGLWGLGFRVLRLGFRAWGIRVQGLGIRV